MSHNARRESCRVRRVNIYTILIDRNREDIEEKFLLAMVIEIDRTHLRRNSAKSCGFVLGSIVDQFPSFGQFPFVHLLDRRGVFAPTGAQAFQIGRQFSILGFQKSHLFYIAGQTIVQSCISFFSRLWIRESPTPAPA
ncbi:conserved hypothetical protein, partial [Trichinella spiralis]|uniref:hypothetical protein n=1 Tax=Trichinella spiralis TaxID=6334 RepID=UPI0001EFD4A2